MTGHQFFLSRYLCLCDTVCFASFTYRHDFHVAVKCVDHLHYQVVLLLFLLRGKLSTSRSCTNFQQCWYSFPSWLKNCVCFSYVHSCLYCIYLLLILCLKNVYKQYHCWWLIFTFVRLDTNGKASPSSLKFKKNNFGKPEVKICPLKLYSICFTFLV